MSAVTIARAWRAEQVDHRAENGVVLIFGGQVYGWKNELRDAGHERPGAIAVDTSGNVFKAEGGTDYDGAKFWVAIQQSLPREEQGLEP